ncbi:shikimate kinase [soil metagenome]
MLILIGLRGSGKTTLARTFAALHPCVWRDLDDLTAAALNHPSAGAALGALGEAAFRAAECAALERVLTSPPLPAILALGGGTPMYPPAREIVRAAQRAGRARIIYLHAPPAILATRLAQDAATLRPPLTAHADPLTESAALYAARDPIYRALGDTTLDTEGRFPNELTGELAALFAAFPQQTPHS